MPTNSWYSDSPCATVSLSFTLTTLLLPHILLQTPHRRPNLTDIRRSKHIATDGCGEETRTDESRVSGFVAGAAAGDLREGRRNNGER